MELRIGSVLKENAVPQRQWTILRLVFLKKRDARLEKCPRGFRAIALLSVFSNWYTTDLVDLLHEEQGPVEWRKTARGRQERSEL